MKKSLIYYFISLFLVKQSSQTNSLELFVLFVFNIEGSDFSNHTGVSHNYLPRFVFRYGDGKKIREHLVRSWLYFDQDFLGISIFQCSVERKFKFDAKFWSVVNFGRNLIFILDCPLISKSGTPSSWSFN